MISTLPLFNSIRDKAWVQQHFLMKSHGPKHVDLIINSFQSSWFLKTLSKTGSVHHGHAWKPSHAVGLIWVWSQDQITHFWSGFYLVWALNDAQSRVPKIPVVSREPLAALPGSGWTQTFQTTTNAFKFFLWSSLFQQGQQLPLFPRWEEKGRFMFWGGFFKLCFAFI